jgi:hypothetical protein
MFLRPCYRKKHGKRHAYWALMESHRTERGPRQRVVAYLGQLDERGRLGVKEAAEGRGRSRQKRLFDDLQPRWVEVHACRVRVENCRDFGGPWLGLELLRGLGWQEFLGQTIPQGREKIPWSSMALVLVLCRLCNLAFLRQGQRLQPAVVGQRVGRLLGRNSRAAGLFAVDVQTDGQQRPSLAWRKVEAWRDRAALSEGCYLLRSNIHDWSDEELWKRYIQLTEAEAAFRVQKSDLAMRPIWHQKEHRVPAHILVCFLAYVLWKSLSRWCLRAGLGHEPRRVFEELGKIRLVDVVLPTRQGTEIRKRCVTRPTDHQAILLQHLGLRLPTRPMADV